MSGYLNFDFIKSKLSKLEYAILNFLDGGVLQIPTRVVTILKIDEIGQLWFIVPRPVQHITCFEKTFSIKLDFYRKGLNFYLNILGKAFLIYDPEELNNLNWLNQTTLQSILHNDSLLIKVITLHAEYTEISDGTQSAKSLLSDAKHKLACFFQIPGQTKISDRVRNGHTHIHRRKYYNYQWADNR